MQNANLNRNRHPRRNLLQAAGITLALPLLNCFQRRLRANENSDPTPMRMVCLCTPLSVHPANFFPTQVGRDYDLSPYFEVLREFRNTISLDQFAAEQMGGLTRFPSLSLSAEGFGLSWTRSGALVPPDLYPASVFARTFLEGRPEEVRLQAQRLQDGRSILDTVREEARSLQPTLG